VFLKNGDRFQACPRGTLWGSRVLAECNYLLGGKNMWRMFGLIIYMRYSEMLKDCERFKGHSWY